MFCSLSVIGEQAIWNGRPIFSNQLVTSLIWNSCHCCYRFLSRRTLRPFTPLPVTFTLLLTAAALRNLTLLNSVLYNVFARESQALAWALYQRHVSKSTRGAIFLGWREMSGLLEWDLMQQSNGGNEDVQEGEAERRRDRLGQTVSKTEAGSWQNSSTEWLITLHLCLWQQEPSLCHSSCPVRSSQTSICFTALQCARVAHNLSRVSLGFRLLSDSLAFAHAVQLKTWTKLD